MNNSTPLPINWAETVPHGTCPSCGAIVMQYIDSPKPNYCFNCGARFTEFFSYGYNNIYMKEL